MREVTQFFNKGRSRGRFHARGYNLIEALVALLVLSLGMAGVASLLVNGMSATGTANLGSVAVTHAQTGVEMMRANLGAYTSGWYDGSNTSSNATTATTCSGNYGCSNTDQASNDFATWRERIASSLPAGLGFICMDSTPDDGQPASLACDGNGNNVVKIFWRNARDAESLDNGASFHRYAVVVSP